MDKTYDTYFLYPGMIYVSSSPVYVTTLLGSCVAVCLYDDKKKLGGMNHFLLPSWNGNGLASPKYGNIAIKQLLENMEKKHGQRKNIVAKLFGGAAVLDQHSDVFRVGDRNIAMAKEMLREFHIPIVAESTGGDRGRKIIFDIITGEVRQKYIQKTSVNKK